MKDIEFVQQLVTKLCHELSGPVGAFSNGLEAMEIDSSEMLDLNMEMTKHASAAALSRLLFFRQAYGVARGDSEVSLSNLKKLVDDYLVDSRVVCLFSLENQDVGFHNSAIKIFLCTIWLCVKSLPQGGKVEVRSFVDGDKKKISLICSGPKISSDMLKVDVLEGRKTQILETTEAHSYYTRRLIEDIDAEFQLKPSNEKLEFNITIKTI